MFAQAIKRRLMDQNNETIDLLKKFSSLSRRYLKLIDRDLKPYQLSSSTYYYIIKLFEFGDLSQDKLVQLTGLNPSNVTRAIQKLISLGYIQKKQNPKDGRSFILSLTNEGKKVYPVIQSTLHQVNNSFLNKFTASEKGQFIELITRL